MKFLCLILWLGEVCTDANDVDADANATNDAHSMIMIVQGSLALCQMSQKQQQRNEARKSWCLIMQPQA